MDKKEIKDRIILYEVHKYKGMYGVIVKNLRVTKEKAYCDVLLVDNVEDIVTRYNKLEYYLAPLYVL